MPFIFIQIATNNIHTPVESSVRVEGRIVIEGLAEKVISSKSRQEQGGRAMRRHRARGRLIRVLENLHVALG